MMTATKSQYQKALDKAAAMGGVRNIIATREYPKGTYYRVRGSVAPNSYTVWALHTGQVNCECPAGSRERPCWHAAVVWTARKAKESQQTHTAGQQAAPGPKTESDATLPPSPRSEATGTRRPLPDEGDDCGEDHAWSIDPDTEREACDTCGQLRGRLRY